MRAPPARPPSVSYAPSTGILGRMLLWILVVIVVVLLIVFLAKRI